MIELLVCALCWLPSAAIQAPSPSASLSADEPAKKSARAYDVRDIALSEDAYYDRKRPQDEVLRDVTDRLAGLLQSFAPLGEGEAVFSFAGPEATLGMVAVVGSEATHAWVREWLELQRSGALLDVSVRLIEAPRGHFAELGLTRSGEPVPADRLHLWTDVGGNGELEVIAAPRLMIRSASHADISVWNEVSYVKDWHTLTVEPGSRKLTVPQIGTLEEGHRVAVLGVLLPDGSLGLDVEVSRSQVDALRVHDFGPDPQTGQPREIVLPEQRGWKLHPKVRLVPGATVYVGSMQQENGREVGVLLRAKLVQPGPREADRR